MQAKMRVCRNADGNYVLCPLKYDEIFYQEEAWVQLLLDDREVQSTLSGSCGSRLFGDLDLDFGDGPVGVEITVKQDN